MKEIIAAFKNLFIGLSRGAVAGSAAVTLIFYAVLLIFYRDLTLVEIFLALQFFCIALCSMFTVTRSFHKHDQDIIGSSFVGLSRKCRLFAQSLDQLFFKTARRRPERLQGARKRLFRRP